MEMMHVGRKTRAAVLGLAALATMLGGCANMTPEQNSAAMGAGLGAVAGAVLGGSGRSAALGAAAGAAVGYIWSDQMQTKQREMERSVSGTGATVSRTADNRLMMVVPSDISFESGSHRLSPQLASILDQLARGIYGQHRMEVLIVGHTDSVGGDDVNYPLSMRRAEAARDRLLDRGIDPRRVFVEGRGASQPVADNTSAYGRSRNRRVEVYLFERR